MINKDLIRRRKFLEDSALSMGVGSLISGGIGSPASMAGVISHQGEREYPLWIRLNGFWEYTPLARTTMGADGLVVDDTRNLPPPGKMEVPSNWQLNGLAGFNGRVRFDRPFNFDEDLT